jgi:acyl carrier protein
MMDDVASLVSVLQDRGETVTVVSQGEEFSRSGEGEFTIDQCDGNQLKRLFREVVTAGVEVSIILCHSARISDRNITVATLKSDHFHSVRILIGLLQIFCEVENQLRLFVVTRGAQAAHSSDHPDPTQSWIWGLGKVVAQECPEWRWTCIDMDPNTAPSMRGSAEEMKVLVAQCMSCTNDNMFAIRAGDRYVPRVVRKTMEIKAASDSEPMCFVEGDTYLVTGAFGAIGARVVRWMVEHGARQFVLVSRGGPSSDEIVTDLERMGARVFVVNADVADSDAVALLFEAAGRTMPPIRGILHAAGVLDDALLRDLSWERFQKVFGPKVYGSWNLHQHSRGLTLDFFVCFSSAASFIGSRGQGNYAAANYFMDSLVHYRRSLGLPGMTINWGAWDGSGMAADMADRLNAMGLEMIAPATGLEILGRLLREDDAQVCVLPANWPKLLASLFDDAPGMFERLAESTALTKQRMIPLLETTPPAKRRKTLEKLVRELVVSVMGRDSFPSTDNKSSFFELGMDSLMSLDLRNRLQTGLDCTLPSTVTFEYPSVTELTEHLISNVLAADLFPRDSAIATPKSLREGG